MDRMTAFLFFFLNLVQWVLMGVKWVLISLLTDEWSENQRRKKGP